MTSLYDLAPLACLSVDSQGYIRQANAKAAQLLTATQQSLTRQRLSQYVLAEDQHLYTLFHRQLFDNAEPQITALRMIKNNGTVFEAELKTITSPGRKEQEKYHMILRDRATPQSLKEERELIAHLLTQINGSGDLRQCMSLLSASLQEWSDCEAVGIRLCKHEDYPYIETRGFPQAFVEKSTSLLSYDTKGEIVCDSSGRPVLECMCGNVLCSHIDPAQPFYTEHGSFWTNGTSALSSKSNAAELPSFTRNNCHEEGYESMALIPLRNGTSALGLIQFNDHRPGHFSPELITHFERLADTLALALSRRQSLQALQEKEEKYRIVANFTYAMETWRKPDGTLGYVSPSCERITGYSVEEFLSSPDLLSEITCPEDRSKVIEYYQYTHKEGKDTNLGLDFRIIAHSGETRWLGHSSRAAYSDNGEWLGRRESYREITNSKEREKQEAKYQTRYWQLRKDRSLGRMAGAVAHHFNNKLHVLINSLEMAMLDLDDMSALQGYLKTSHEMTDQLAELSRSMLIYLGQITDTREQIDLADVCKKILPFVQSVIPDNFVIESDLMVPGPQIISNHSQIHQIVINLITNAVEASGSGQSTLHLRVHTVTAADIPETNRCPANWQSVEKEYGCLEVHDSGCGLSLPEIEVVFDPFYTTKFTGRGMGLAMVSGIVQAHGGVATVESISGAGSVFRIFLPLTKGKEPSALHEPAVLEEEEHKGSVLLIDDDESILSVSRAMFSHFGYTVLEASSGNEGVEMFKMYQDDIVLILSDFSMPGLNGMETLEVLRRMAPNLPMILASGYSEEQVMDDTYSEEPSFFLKKPYTMRSLHNAISHALKKQ